MEIWTHTSSTLIAARDSGTGPPVTVAGGEIVGLGVNPESTPVWRDERRNLTVLRRPAGSTAVVCVYSSAGRE